MNWGLVALNNNAMKIDLILTERQTPYERKFYAGKPTKHWKPTLT